MKRGSVVPLLCLLCAAPQLASQSATQENSPQHAVVQKSSAHDRSEQTLSSIKPSKRLSKGVTRLHPVKPLNYPKGPKNFAAAHLNPAMVQRKADHPFGSPHGETQSAPTNKGNSGAPRGASFVTEQAGLSRSANPPASPIFGGFEGIGDNASTDRNYAVDSAPSDTNGAVGVKHFVEWVNETLAIFDKANGNVLVGPILGNQIWKNFARSPNGDLHPCEKDNDGDPIVLYDKTHDRWILSQFAIDQEPFYECIAVSTSGDPTGTYNRYAYEFDKFNDYPKLAIWHDGYYATFNMFEGQTQVGTKICAINSAKMIAGDEGQIICVDLPVAGGVGGVLAADLDGPPPPDKPSEFLMNLGFNEMQLWTLAVDWQHGTASLQGPKHIKVEPFKGACEDRNGGSCVSQPGRAPLLEALGDRLMYRLQYRHFGDHEALVVNHTVEVPISANQFTTGIRWYEVRDLRSPQPSVYQQRTYAPDNNFRWMGSIAADKQGNLLLGYSVSSTRVYPSIRFAGRFASDPVGELSAEAKVAEGAGTQVAGDRWGDYSSVSIDPVDDCTFWFAAQYQKDNGSPNAYNWRTYVRSVRFPNCKE